MVSWGVTCIQGGFPGGRHWSWTGKDGGAGKESQVAGARNRLRYWWEPPRHGVAHPAHRGTATGMVGEPGEAHSLVSHSSPSQPLGQKQRKASTSSIHVPPLRHGWPRQSSMSAGGRGEQGPQLAQPPPGPQPLTLVAVGTREAAVADAREIAPGLADAVSVGAAHAVRGRCTAHPGSRLQTTAIDHCGKRGRVSPPPSL